MKIFTIVLILALSITLVNAQWSIDLNEKSSSDDWSVDVTPTIPINYTTKNVNSSEYWDSLNTFNTTQMEDNGGVLNILVSWLESLFYTETEVDTILEDYVPYTGATDDVDLGSNDLSTTGSIKNNADNSKHYFGAGDDYSIEWDGSDAVHTITAGDFVFSGGNVGIGTDSPGASLHIVRDSYFDIQRWTRDAVGSGHGDYSVYLSLYRWGLKDEYNNELLTQIYWDDAGFGSMANFIAGKDDGSQTVPNDAIFRAGNADYRVSDTSGANLYIASGKGEGNGTASKLYFATPTPQGSGSTTQPLVVRWTIDSDYGLKSGTDGTGVYDIVTAGNIYNKADSAKHYFGAGDDYSIEWDGSDAVHTITAGDFVFSGGDVEVLGETDPAITIKRSVSGDMPTYSDIGLLNFYGKDDNNDLIAAQIKAITVGSWGVGDAGTRMEFSVTGKDGIALQSILTLEYDNTYNVPRVGIGTTTPQRTLHIVNDDTNTIGSGLLFQQDGTGDPKIALKIGSAGQEYDFGIDNSDSDYLKLSRGSRVSDDVMVVWDTSSNMHLPNDNQKLLFGAGNDASIYYDGTNLIFNTNETGDGIAWFSSNISAIDYITRTSVYDKDNGKALDNIKSSDELKNAFTGKIEHNRFYGYTTYQVTDYSKPVNESYEVEVCNEDGLSCHNETEYRIIYPHKKTEEGVNLNKEIDVLREAVYEIKLKNEELESRIEALERGTTPK